MMSPQTLRYCLIGGAGEGTYLQQLGHNLEHLGGVVTVKVLGQRYGQVHQRVTVNRLVRQFAGQFLKEANDELLKVITKFYKLEWPDISSWGQDFFRG